MDTIGNRCQSEVTVQLEKPTLTVEKRFVATSPSNNIK